MQNLAFKLYHYRDFKYDLSQCDLIEYFLLYDPIFGACCGIMAAFMAFFYYNTDARIFLEENLGKYCSKQRCKIFMRIYIVILYILLLYYLFVSAYRIYDSHHYL